MPAEPGSLLFVPSFSNLNYSWKVNGKLLNIEFGDERSHILKAVMEGITMSVRTIIDDLRGKGMTVRSIRMSGGRSRSEVWNRIRADIYGIPVVLLQTSGNWLPRFVGVRSRVSWSIFKCEEAAEMMVHVTRTYRPDPSRAEAYESTYRRFKSAYVQGSRS